MMRAAYGLIWEEWRRTRKLCAVSLVLLAGIAVVPWYFVRVGAAGQLYSILSYGLLGMFIIYLTLSHSTKNDIQAGVPRRRYLLPVGTFALVFWPLAYRLALVATLASLASVLAMWMYDSKNPHLMLTCYVMAVAALVTMLAWSARLMGKVLTVLGFFLLIFPGLNWMARYMDAGFLPHPWVELLLPTAAAIVTLAVTTFSLSIVRSGGWGYVLPTRASTAAPTATAKTDHKPFPTMLLAQIWYEWRSVGVKMTLIISCPSCALLLMPFLVAESTSIWTVIESGWQMLLLICVPAGLWAFTKHGTNDRRGAARFAQTRCVDDSLLAWAKLGGSAATLLGSFVVITVFSWLSYIVFVKLGLGFGHITITDELPPTFAKAGSSVFLILAGMWICYTRGGFVSAVVIIVPLATAFCSRIWPAAYAYLWDTTDSMDTPRMLHLALPVCVLICLTSFVLAWKRSVISSRTLAIIAIAWASGTVLGTAILRGFVMNVLDVSLATLSAYVAVLTLLALTPFATTSLQVHRLRHR